MYKNVKFYLYSSKLKDKYKLSTIKTIFHKVFISTLFAFFILVSKILKKHIYLSAKVKGKILNAICQIYQFQVYCCNGLYKNVKFYLYSSKLKDKYKLSTIKTIFHKVFISTLFAFFILVSKILKKHIYLSAKVKGKILNAICQIYQFAYFGQS